MLTSARLVKSRQRARPNQPLAHRSVTAIPLLNPCSIPWRRERERGKKPPTRQSRAREARPLVERHKSSSIRARALRRCQDFSSPFACHSHPRRPLFPLSYFRRNSCSGSNPICSRRGQVPRSSRRPKVRAAWPMASIRCETNLRPNHQKRSPPWTTIALP